MNEKKLKILILMTEAGNAHRIAASALQDCIGNRAEVKVMDLLKELDIEPFNTSEISYSLVSQNHLFDSVNIFASNFFNTEIGFRLFSDYVNARLFADTEKLIEREKPDIVVSNHPITSIPVGKLREKKDNFKFVITLLDLKSFFRSQADVRADLIFAPTHDAVNGLVKYGVDIKKVIFPLFPIREQLRNYRAIEEVLKQHNLTMDKPIVLITGGGLGGKTLSKFIHRLAERRDIVKIVLTGRLEYFKKGLERIYQDRDDFRIIGFVDNMQDYINASDVVIAKPGATTIVEMEVFNKKAIFTRRVGHVEMEHDEYVRRNPLFRYIGSDVNKLLSSIDELLRMEINPSSKRTLRNFDEIDIISKEILKL